MNDYAGISTVLTVSAMAAANCYLNQDTAFTNGVGVHQTTHQNVQLRTGMQPPSMAEAVGTTGLLAYGAGFGALVAGLHGIARRSISRSSRRAEKSTKIDVKEKEEKGGATTVPYFSNIPRTILDKRTLDVMLSSLPKEQWENPPEDHPLYQVKCYAEVYGEGKATRMGTWDYLYMKVNQRSAQEEYDDEYDYERTLETVEEWKKACDGKVPLFIPGALGSWDTGANVKWQGPELFAGDQCVTPVTQGSFARNFEDNTAFYRKGLEPWQRGLEIGMAHGYFLIGPFVSLGPLRNTPEAATVGLLCGIAVIGIVSAGGLMFGKIQKPAFFDKPDTKERGAGFNELIQWHAFGGVGGAGFAHMLLTVFAGYGA